VGAVPVLRGGKSWGVLVVMSSFSGAFDPDTVELFVGVSRFLEHAFDELAMRKDLEFEKERQEWEATHDALTIDPFWEDRIFVTVDFWKLLVGLYEQRVFPFFCGNVLIIDSFEWGCSGGRFEFQR